MHRFGHHWMDGHSWGGGFWGGPGMLLSLLGTLAWIALMIGLAWAILSLLMPTIRPMLADIFGSKSANISALEILRQRYASGEIDGVTFEQMHERLLASYQHEGDGVPRDAGYQEEGWIRYKNT
jgi:uncharacterized membrane protein